MKLTTILYGIILCLAIENGNYYTLAAVGDKNAPPVTVSTPTTSTATSTATSLPGGGAKVSTPSTTTATSTATSLPGGGGKSVVSSGGNTGSSASLSTSTSTTTSTSGSIVSPGPPIISPTDEFKLKGGEKDAKIVKDGCNFYDKLDLGIKPFGEIKGNKTVCSVVLNQEFDAFLYACDGTSDPPKCPSEVKTEDGVVKIETLFSQATVTDQSAKFTSKPNLFHVITGKANKQFSASCVCTKKDGTKETMELTSSFKKAGILGILGLFVVYLMN